jgi:hypothetical protein
MAVSSVRLFNRLDDRVRETLSSGGELGERVSKLSDTRESDTSFRVLGRRQELPTSLLGDAFGAPMVV